MECPYLKTTLAGDEIYEFCTLEETTCLLVGGYECDTYNKILKEEEDATTTDNRK